MLDRSKVENFLRKYDIDEKIIKNMSKDLVDNYDNLLVTIDTKQYLMYMKYQECDKSLPENLIKIKDKLFLTAEEDRSIRYSYQKEYFIRPYLLTYYVIYDILQRSINPHSSIRIKQIIINNEELLKEFIDNISNDIKTFVEEKDIYIKNIELIFKDYVFSIKYVQGCNWVIETNAPIETFKEFSSILYNFIFR